MTNLDLTRECLRECITEPRSDYGLGECAGCDATLTSADFENNECSQCGAILTTDEDDDDQCRMSYEGLYESCGGR